MGSDWTEQNGGYFHATVRTTVVKRTCGNPNRTGDWFAQYGRFGQRQDVAVELARHFPAAGVKTLKQAKRIVERVAALIDARKRDSLVGRNTLSGVRRVAE